MWPTLWFVELRILFYQQHSRNFKNIVLFEEGSTVARLMVYSDRTYVGTGPEWVTVFYVKPSHCNLCGNLNGSYTLHCISAGPGPGPGPT